MSSLIFSHAKSIRNKAKKYARELATTNELLGENYNESYNKCYDNAIRNEVHEFEEVLKIASLLHEKYLEVTNKVTNQWYFITVRPDESKIDFNSFYRTVQKYLKRNCIKYYYCSFEQKATDVENLGKGFHVHILADATWRSKMECLRDTQSTFNKCTAPNCVQVFPTKEPEKIKDDYLIEYKSDDGHKIITKDMDSLWRNKENLQDIYYGELPERSVPIKSEQGQIIISLA